MHSTKLFLQAALVLAYGATLSLAQESKPTEGIPISDPLTIAKCGGCHQRDANGMMRRLSYMRTTPEVWEEAIKRMVRLNGLAIKPEEARDILRYLSANNGLAPEEAKPIFWEAEHRLFRDQSDKIPSDALQHTCNYCHTIGRVLGQRRTKDDYDKLIAMHIGLFPGAENTLHPRRRPGPVEEAPVVMTASPTGYPAVLPSADPAARADGKYPAEIAVEYLAKAQPLMTPDWATWKAMMQTPKLEGKWLLQGSQEGKGRIFGTVTIEAGSTSGEFTTKIEIEYAATGKTLTRSGKSIVYTGYSWRGRSMAPKGEPVSTDPGFDPAEWREALLVGRDGNTMEGRWFWGGYEEFGIDAHLTRIGSAPLLVGTNTYSLKSPSTSELKVYGANFPADLKPSDFDLGPGVTVKRVLKKTGSIATVEVDVRAGLPTGVRDISLARSTAERALAIYDKIAYIKVLPDASMARLGGTIAAKQYAQFEAVAYASGADGKAGTADDIPIGPVSASWSMEEFVSTPNDDDVKFVGSINDSGLFTPNLEGPNPARKKQTNNYPTNNWGDVWVDATFNVDGKPMKARSYLVVTIPVYMHYDQPEVGQ
jgi:quinohemoprotein amine dehydrogenase